MISSSPAEHRDGPVLLSQTADIKIFRQTPKLKSSDKSVTKLGCDDYQGGVRRIRVPRVGAGVVVLSLDGKDADGRRSDPELQE